MLVLILLISCFILYILRQRRNNLEEETALVAGVKILAWVISILATVTISIFLIVYGLAVSADDNIEKLLMRNDVIMEELQPKITMNIEHIESIGIDTSKLDGWSQKLWTEYQKNLEKIETYKQYKENISSYRWWLSFGIL